MSLLAPMGPFAPMAYMPSGAPSYSYPQVPRTYVPDRRSIASLGSYPQLNGYATNGGFGSQVLPNSLSKANGNLSQASDELTKRYDLTGVTLGAGKHSEVVQVRRKADGQTFAAKIISLKSNDEMKVDREIRAMQKFKHKYSTRIVEHIRGSQQLPNVKLPPPYICIVMNQIDGDPLTATLFKSGPNPSLAWKLLSQLGSVLSELHNQQLAHRDVWSENILLDRNGDFYLIDYGCAESTISPSALAGKEGLNLPYLSPQTCMKQPPSSGDDMWALGLVLTELVTGKHLIHRMGSNNNPFFLQPDLLKATLDETAAIGGQQLGNIAKALLAENTNQRASASDLLAMAAGQQQIGKSPSFMPATPILGNRNSLNGLASSYSSFKAMDSSIKFAAPNNGTSNGFAGSVVADISPPRVQSRYQPSVCNSPYQSVAMGRPGALGSSGWII